MSWHVSSRAQLPAGDLSRTRGRLSALSLPQIHLKTYICFSPAKTGHRNKQGIQTMKACVIESAGGPEVLHLRDIPSATPNADEVRIRVRAFGINRAEVYRRAGTMGPIAGLVVPGIEAVGEVVEDPSGTFRTGQRVATAMGGLQFTRPGSYAEEVTVLRSNVIDLDGTTLSWEDLAAVPESYLTVWGALG